MNANAVGKTFVSLGRLRCPHDTGITMEEGRQRVVGRENSVRVRNTTKPADALYEK